MKRYSRTAVRIDSVVYREAGAVLDEGESLSCFVAQCVRSGVVWRRAQDALMMRARDAVERGVHEGGGITPEDLLKLMDERIDAAEVRLARAQR